MSSTSDAETLKDPATKQKIIGLLQTGLSATQQAAVAELVETSIDAINADNGAKAVLALGELRGHIQEIRSDPAGRWGEDKMMFCYDKCEHYLNENKPKEYATCFYICMLRVRPFPPPE
jgi:hypothetical protein